MSDQMKLDEAKSLVNEQWENLQMAHQETMAASQREITMKYAYLKATESLSWLEKELAAKAAVLVVEKAAVVAAELVTRSATKSTNESLDVMGKARVVAFEVLELAKSAAQEMLEHSANAEIEWNKKGKIVSLIPNNDLITKLHR